MYNTGYQKEVKKSESGKYLTYIGTIAVRESTLGGLPILPVPIKNYNRLISLFAYHRFSKPTRNTKLFQIEN